MAGLSKRRVHKTVSEHSAFGCCLLNAAGTRRLLGLCGRHRRLLWAGWAMFARAHGAANKAACCHLPAVPVEAQLPSRGMETTVTAGSLLNDLLTKPARALTVLGALQDHEEGPRKVKSMPTWVNLSQGGSTLHSPEATEKKR